MTLLHKKFKEINKNIENYILSIYNAHLYTICSLAPTIRTNFSECVQQQ